MDLASSLQPCPLRKPSGRMTVVDFAMLGPDQEIVGKPDARSLSKTKMAVFPKGTTAILS
jgi:hypothetical protein